jgi:Domain of unknown function (DUF4124)
MRSKLLGFSIAMMLGGTMTAAHAVDRSGGHRYKWTDAQGLVHYSDNLTQDALMVGYDVINQQGVIVKHVDRAKTPEEIKAAEATAAAAAIAKREADHQAQADQQTLAAYSSERELRTAQQSQLDMIDQNIHATDISLANQEKSLTEVLGHAASLDRNGKPVPATLQSQIDALRKNIDQQKAYIVKKKKEKEDTQKAFTAELDHYRELRSKRDTN